MTINPAERAARQKEAQQAIGNIADRFKKQPPAYVPIGKSLEAISMDVKIMDIMIGDEPVECLVIPVDELMRKEWIQMGGGFNNPNKIPANLPEVVDTPKESEPK